MFKQNIAYQHRAGFNIFFWGGDEGLLFGKKTFSNNKGDVGAP